MKSKFLIFPLILMGFVIILFNSCDPDEDADEPTLTGPPITPINEEDIEFKDRTINVASEPMELESIDGETYTFNLTGECPVIQVGDILIGDDDEYGYVRKVTEVVSQTTSRLVINTVQGSLSDALKRLDIDETIDMPMQAPIFPIAGVHVMGDSMYMNNFVLVDESFHFPPLPSLHLYSYVDKAYVVTKEATLDIDLHIADGEVTEFRTLYQANTFFGCDIAVDVSALLDYNMEPILLYEQTEKIKHMVGPVPVIHKVTTSYTLQAHFELLGQLNTLITGIGFNQTMDIGAHYNNSSWQNLSTTQIDWNEPEITMTAKAQATIRPSIVIKVVDELYGVAGPSVRAEPYLEGIASYTWGSSEFCLEVKAGITIGCGFQGLDLIGIPDWDSPNTPPLTFTIFPEHCW